MPIIVVGLDDDLTRIDDFTVRNAQKVGIQLYQVVVNAHGIQERLCVTGHRVSDSPVPRPASIADHKHQRESRIYRHSPNGIP